MRLQDLPPEELEYRLAARMPWGLRLAAFKLGRAFGAPLLPALHVLFSRKALLRQMILRRAEAEREAAERLKHTFILDGDGVRGARDESEAWF